MYSDFTIVIKGWAIYPFFIFHLKIHKMFRSFDSLREAGFAGFKSVRDLWNDCSCIPNERGVYVVLNPTCSNKAFLPKGVGGYFKGTDPNVSLSKLDFKWIQDCHVLYIGQAGGNGSSATLRKRLKQYLDFGKGKPVGHKGGRYIWQLKHHNELVMAWRVLRTDDPSFVENQLLSAFCNQYGKLPFANLRM